MNDASKEPLSDIERRAESARAALAGTVDELRHRVSPGALKEEVRQYVRDTGQGMFADLRQKANENPLQVVALGAGLAFPAWRILQSLPAPVLLIGAGVALAGRSKRPVESSDVRLSSEHAEQSPVHAPAAAGVPTASSRTVGVASSFHGSAGDRSSSGAHQTGAAVRESGDRLVEVIKDHPLAAGGIGLLIGAAIAASLPRSQIENRIFGEAIDELKDRASDAVPQTAHRVAQT